MRTASRTPHATRTARASHRAAAVRADRRARRQLAPLQARSTGAAHRGAHLTRRGRVVALAVLVALLFAAFSFGRFGSQAATSPEPRPAVSQTTVQPGESLWTVAKRVAPRTDPRETVEQLRRMNDLAGSSLQAGQQLLLPA